MEIGNQMQNHKIETNNELIYEDGSIRSTLVFLVFIKIIGSYRRWFPLPPSEVLNDNHECSNMEANILPTDPPTSLPQPKPWRWGH